MPSHGRAANALTRGLALWAMSFALGSAVCAAQASRPPQQRREAVCAGYAERAVAQAEENRGRDCGLLGPRWSDDYQAHYRWCLVAPLEEIQREAEARLQALKRCGGPDDPAAPCRAYADEAVAQERENQRRQCGFSGPRWSLDGDGHYAWCMLTQGVAAGRESEARSRMLESECAEEPPVDTSFCEEVAERSVEQHAENLRRGCGFSGVDWTSSLEAHLELCLAATPEEATRRLGGRQQALTERCVVEPEPTGPGEPPEPREPPGRTEPPRGPEKKAPLPPDGPPRIPWLWIIGGLAMIGVVLLLINGGSKDGGERRQSGELPELVAVPDLGTQELQAERLLDAEVELRPVLDSGTQNLETAGRLIAEERRIDR